MTADPYLTWRWPSRELSIGRSLTRHRHPPGAAPSGGLQLCSVARSLAAPVYPPPEFGYQTCPPMVTCVLRDTCLARAARKVQGLLTRERHTLDQIRSEFMFRFAVYPAVSV